MLAIEVMLEVLHRAQVRHIFGNPGTTELPLLEALSRDNRFQYFLGPQEIPVMAMADGYAMASGQIAVVNLHAACGLGNAMGMLYNAWCEGTPLLVTAGQQDRRLRLGEPVLEAELLPVARPWTKWAYEVQRPEDIATATRRAIQIALTPPTGPVFLSLPVDMQMQRCDDADCSPPTPIGRGQGLDADAVRRAAELLSKARHPVILAGSRVTEAGACEALARLAELLEAPVISECTTSHGRLPLRSDHPLYDELLSPWSPDVRKRLEPFDCLLAVGLDVLRLYIHQRPERPLPETARIVQLDSDARQLGKNYPVDAALWGDPKRGLVELAEAVEQLWGDERPKEVAERGRMHRERIEKMRRNVRKQIDAERSRVPMTSRALMGTLAEHLPSDAAVVEEAITTHHNVLEQLGVIRDPAAHFAHRGWSLGWGLGCALGVKLAWPERPVVGLLGDGAALYGIQGLWMAAHYHIPVTFVVANNRRYKILQVCGQVMKLPRVADARCPGVNLVEPDVNFVRLAEGFGVRGCAVRAADELAAALSESIASDSPMLIDAELQDE